VPRVHIAVGRPGLDHDGVEHLPATGSAVVNPAAAASEAASVAGVLAAIYAALPGEQPC
jgi:hypothetical protein